MRHDKRDDDGTYRCCTPAEERVKQARMETQTHSGFSTHERDAAKRRTGINVTVPRTVPLFVDQRTNRRRFDPFAKETDR